jgi:hypothetical protein
MDERQQLIDDEHLRLLRIGYIISGCTNLLWVFFPLFYVGMGFLVLVLPASGSRNEHPPREVGLIFIAIGAFIFLFMAVITILKFLTARAIGRRRSRLLCFITATITCLAVPYGTLLGVATFIVLLRPSVQARFVP